MNGSFFDNGKLIKGAVIAVGSFVAYRAYKKQKDEKARREAAVKVDDNANYAMANLLRSSINPSGIDLFKKMDFTSVTRVMEAARNITDLDEVIKAYRNLFGDDLLEDLLKDLGPEEFQKFMTIVTTNPNKVQGKDKAPPVTFTKRGNLIVAKKPVYLRSEADATNHGMFYEFSNKTIVREAKAGEFLGYATGEQQFDEVNNVKFIRIGFKVDPKTAPKEYKDKAKEPIFYWVTTSSTYINQYENKAKAYMHYPNLGKYFIWMRPFTSALEKQANIKKLTHSKAGSKAIAKSTTETLKKLKAKNKPINGLVTLRKSVVLNHALQPIAIAERNTLLGRLEMTLDTNNEKYYQFKTKDNQTRWINTENATLL